MREIATLRKSHMPPGNICLVRYCPCIYRSRLRHFPQDQYWGDLHLDSFHQNERRKSALKFFHTIGCASCTKRQPAFWIITLDYCQILMPRAQRWKRARPGMEIFIPSPALGVIWTNWRRTSRVLCLRRHFSALPTSIWIIQPQMGELDVRPLRVWKRAIFALSFNSKIIALAPETNWNMTWTNANSLCIHIRLRGWFIPALPAWASFKPLQLFYHL